MLSGDATDEDHLKAEAQGASRWMVDTVIKAPKGIAR